MLLKYFLSFQNNNQTQFYQDKPISRILFQSALGGQETIIYLAPMLPSGSSGTSAKVADTTLHQVGLAIIGHYWPRTAVAHNFANQLIKRTQTSAHFSPFSAFVSGIMPEEQNREPMHLFQ